ncbi:MAG: HAMP domain-containing sensor histidine kinase [Bacteroidales bacterium]|nr:HAMP domain-containing sensor histidine kinase [Bacteroidales bacterium]
MNLKFKNRIAIFNTIAVALTTALVFIVIYSVVHKTAYSHLDDDILIEKEDVFSNLNTTNNSIIINKMPEWDEAEHREVEVNPTFLQIVDAEGVVIFHSANMMKDQILYNPKIETESFFDSELNKQPIRLGQFPIKNDKNEVIGQLTIAIPQQESINILNNLILVLLIAFPIVLFIQFLASWFAASKSIEPVNELIKTASGIGDSNIGTRLSLPVRHDEIYVLTQTINDLLARIETSIVQQKQFTSNASHEIRTPLAAIRGTLEVLIRKQRDPEFYENKISEIISQVDRIDTLLEQLLQLARLESGVAISKCENVELEALIASLTHKWKESATTKNITIQIDIPKSYTMVGDRLFMEIILNNLVNNALKYGNQNGIVSIQIDANTLSINDNGMGISIAQLPYIFNRFYRTDESRSSTIKGNGLGLSIVKKLCELQNIVIDVESKEGEFTKFTLHFTGKKS